ncbi:MAG: hypothetical protein AB7P23_07460 [Amphiplicatus sp.]
MPRKRKSELSELRALGALEKRIKALRSYIAAEREAMEFRKFLRSRRFELLEAARTRRRYAKARRLGVEAYRLADEDERK